MRECFLDLLNQRLHFLCQNQKTLRADTYINIEHEIENRRWQAAGEDSIPEGRIGRVLLPKSHTGSPRYCNDQFKYGMAVVCQYGKPDFFVTITCNPNWPEIKTAGVHGQTPHDHPDIVDQVFKLKNINLCIISKVVYLAR